MGELVALPASIVPSPEPWDIPILWSGQLATQLCAPNGIASCSGARYGEHQDLHILATERKPSSVDLELRWNPTSASAREMILWLDAVTVGQGCDDCTSYRFRVLQKVQGPSPLTLSAADVDLRDHEQLAVLVRIPDGVSGPVVAQAYNAQSFVVDGMMHGE